jgi:hypothetical protein
MFSHIISHSNLPFFHDLENTEENCGIIWEIQKKSKLNSEKIGKIWKKRKLNSEKIRKIQKKIEKMK